jgi:transposase
VSNYARDLLFKTSKEKTRKGVMFTDRARQHCSNKVKEYLKENKDSIKIFYFPKGSPD